MDLTEIHALVARTTTSAVSDVLNKRGLKMSMPQHIRPLDMGVKMFGPALTIERRPVALTEREGARPATDFLDALENAPSGTVLVLKGDQQSRAAIWGGLMTAGAIRSGVAGIVVDGPIRDPLEIVEMKLPCFCTGSVPAGAAGVLALTDIGRPLDCAGVVVHAGDYVFGDSNGVVVIPAGIEHEVLRDAVEVEERDQQATRMILDGAGFRETMKTLGRG